MEKIELKPLVCDVCGVECGWTFPDHMLEKHPEKCDKIYAEFMYGKEYAENWENKIQKEI